MDLVPQNCKPVEKEAERDGIETSWKKVLLSKVHSDCKSWNLGDFAPRETIGTGTFGRVILAFHKESGQVFAIKTLKKHKILQMKQLQHVLDEKSIQIHLVCPFTVQLYRTFQDEHKLYFVLEYAPGGELFTWLRKNKRFPNNIARFFFCEIFTALEYLHRKGFVYRDLKPENVLIDAEGHVKVADFGFAKYIGTEKTWTMCGTPEYLARNHYSDLIV
jgi:protein kinase A